MFKALLKAIVSTVSQDVQEIVACDPKPVLGFVQLLQGYVEIGWLYLQQSVKWYCFAKDMGNVPVELWFSDVSGAVDTLLYERAMQQEAEVWYATHTK